MNQQEQTEQIAEMDQFVNDVIFCVYPLSELYPIQMAIAKVAALNPVCHCHSTFTCTKPMFFSPIHVSSSWKCVDRRRRLANQEHTEKLLDEIFDELEHSKHSGTK